MRPSNWQDKSLVEQLANIGSEIIRSLKWSGKNAQYAQLASFRALELFDLTLDLPLSFSQLKEVARARELWLDFSVGNNQYRQTASQFEKYYLNFNYFAQNQSPL